MNTYVVTVPQLLMRNRAGVPGVAIGTAGGDIIITTLHQGDVVVADEARASLIYEWAGTDARTRQVWMPVSWTSPGATQTLTGWMLSSELRPGDAQPREYLRLQPQTFLRQQREERIATAPAPMLSRRFFRPF